MRLNHASKLALAAVLASVCLPAASYAGGPGPDGLLFRASGDKGLVADTAAGEAKPNFASGVTIVPDGAIGPAMRWSDSGYVAWQAAGNIYAQHSSLSFFWRPREPVGEAPFVIFRVGYADHTSWDMTFARIDWNGHGFDAFVTDANLSRLRVSWTMPTPPAADSWHHIAFGWDETRGVVLYVDGHMAASKVQKADLDSGLDQFGLAGRVLSPHQVQSRYSYMRGSDIDELRVYDHLLGPEEAADLAAKREPAPPPPTSEADERAAWLHRFGWDTATPPVLDAPVTTIRKIEFADAKDLKQWMFKGVDGIPETTWPGVYNRSRLPGRDDYFELPDWLTYVEGGKAYDLTLPAGEAFSRVEIRGAAYGTLSWTAPDGTTHTLAKRPQGMVRSIDSFAPLFGGTLHFTNAAQEQPIQELWTYNISNAGEPAGKFKLSYTIRSALSADFAALDGLNQFIAGRYPSNERETVVALPSSTAQAAASAGDPTSSAPAVRLAGAAPLVHILIPSSFSDAHAGQELARAWDYGWENLHDGLDGIAIDLPALSVTPNAAGLIPLTITVMDPLWPQREMIDVSVSVRPHQARTLWLDLRDRILPNKSFYLRIASASADFGAKSLDGAQIRLVFKDRAKALPEHIADRFSQVKDNWGYLVEEHTASRREAIYNRLYGDITDLLRVDPENREARAYWADMDYNPRNLPDVVQPQPPVGVPLWAFRQTQDLRLVKQFADWWIDNRQVAYGDLGGGLSDDTDLMQQWPGIALMGVEPDKLNASLTAVDEATFKNGMRVGGLAYITTDELHSYEEGLNSDAERLYLNWGEPVTVERLMETSKALTRIVMVNPAGHMHFASNWFGGRKIYREGPWEWQKPYSFTILHAPILMGVYNRNPIATGMITGVMDGLLAHGQQDEKGTWTFPNEINWRSDATRAGDGGGISTPLQAAWAAWRFSGDARYLRPLEAQIAHSGPKVLNDINENAFTVMPGGDAYARAYMAKKMEGSGALPRYDAWQITGDSDWLAALHGDAIADKMQHMYMVTEGHWWIDRVEQPSDILQRERLGGVALRRGQAYPGHTVSWRFAHDEDALSTAILLPSPQPDHFRVLAYNLTDKPIAARMTGWNITAGRWRMTEATSSDGGKTLAAPTSHAITLERSASVPVSFAPGVTTALEFTLLSPSAPTETRADLGIGAQDVAVHGQVVDLTVHSLGAKPVPGGTAWIEDAGGRILAHAPIGPMPAPTDLQPKTTKLRLRLHGSIPAGARVRVALPGNAPEVTMLNNSVPLPQPAH